MKRGDFAIFHKTVIRNLAGEPYLVRWRLFQTPLFAVYLHRILRSDDDRALHDHPWAFVSLILLGGYFEHTPGGCRWRRPGSIVAHHAEDLHRLELRPAKTAWTLVLCGPRRRQWGFSTGGGLARIGGVSGRSDRGGEPLSWPAMRPATTVRKDSDVSPFELRNDPPRRGADRAGDGHSEVIDLDVDHLAQRRLFDGMECLPGQMELFETDGDG